MVDFWTPALLRESAPDTKILVILRDPFDRFCSGVTHDLQRRAPHHPIITELGVRKSTYRQQLRRMLNHFDRDALLVLQYERCRLDPRGELRRTLEFLGLDDFEPPPALLQYGANVTEGRRYQPEARVREAFIDTLSGDLSRLLADFPEIDPSLWPSCEGLVLPAVAQYNCLFVAAALAAVYFTAHLCSWAGDLGEVGGVTRVRAIRRAGSSARPGRRSTDATASHGARRTRSATRARSGPPRDRGR